MGWRRGRLRRAALGCDELAVLGVGEVLVRGAVAVVRQWRSLARGALAGRGTALRRRSADGGVALVRMLEQELLRVCHVAVDHAVHVPLGPHGKVAADIAEERSRGPREVMTIGGQARDHLLARAQHCRVIARRRLAAARLQDLGGELSIYGATELIHGADSLPSLSLDLVWEHTLPKRLRPPRRPFHQQEHVYAAKGAR